MTRGRRLRARNGRQGLGAFLSHAVGCLSTYLGVLSQALDVIGANGFMVLRLRVTCVDRKRHTFVSRLKCAKRCGADPFLGCRLKFTLRRSRGAIGRYQGTSGAAVASLGVPRRRGRLRRRGPGAGKGLTQNKPLQRAGIEIRYLSKACTATACTNPQW